jgi:hypothetical protein
MRVHIIFKPAARIKDYAGGGCASSISVWRIWPDDCQKGGKAVPIGQN